ncbi:retrovirus-related pol polyprotein from transposon TNT 1-94, partial [Tanacetum coccineum]
GIEHQTSTARTPEQNGIVKRSKRTLVEAARIMPSAAKIPVFFWAEAIATTCFTQNCSLVLPRHEKTPYHIINGRKPTVNSFTSLAHCATLLKITTVLEHDSLIPDPQSHENVPLADETVTTSFNELDMLFSLMFDEYFNEATLVVSKSFVVPIADASDKRHQSNTTPYNLTTVTAYTTQLDIQTTPETTTQAPPVTATENIDQAEHVMVDKDEFINIFSTLVYEVGEPSSRHVDPPNMHIFYQRHPSKHHWTRDHPLEQVIRNPSQPVITRRQLKTDGEMYMFALIVSRTKQKNIKEVMADHAWIEAIQEELH